MSYEGRRRPIFERLPVDPSLDGIEREVKMWRACLDMALYDAFMCCETLEDEENKKDAVAFWEVDKEDLETVCDMAMVDIAFARKVYQRFHNRFGAN